MEWVLTCGDNGYPGSVNDPAPRAIVIRACDRPAQLRSLLNSLATYEARYQTRQRYIVLDSSRRPEALRANAALLDAFSNRTRGTVAHFDSARGQENVARLAAGDVAARNALDIAVTTDGRQDARPDYGKAWNLAVLACSGGRYIMLDEDNVLPVCLPTNSRDGVDPVPHAASSAYFYPDVDLALAAGSELDDDPFLDALDLCGQTVNDRRIVTVTHGHRGHSCSQSSHWMFFLDSTSRSDFWADDERIFLRNLSGESVWYGGDQCFVLPFANYTPFAIDDTHLLPPTLPHGRGEDMIFGLLIAITEPTSLALHTNRTLGHRQEANRARIALLYRPWIPVFNLMVGDFIAGHRPTAAAGDPAHTMTSLASRLRDRAHAPPRDRLATMRDFVQRSRQDLCDRLNVALEAAYQPPDYWVDAVQRVIDVNRHALADTVTFSDGPTDLTSKIAAQVMCERLESFADVLDAWPMLWARAEAADMLGIPK